MREKAFTIINLSTFKESFHITCNNGDSTIYTLPYACVSATLIEAHLHLVTSSFFFCVNILVTNSTVVGLKNPQTPSNNKQE